MSSRGGIKPTHLGGCQIFLGPCCLNSLSVLIGLGKDLSAWLLKMATRWEVRAEILHDGSGEVRDGTRFLSKGHIQISGGTHEQFGKIYSEL